MDNKTAYSYQDSFLWGFGNGWLNKPQPGEHLRLKFTAPSRLKTSFREEIFRAAWLIPTYSYKPLVLALAGGYDSQAIAIALKTQKIPFKAVTKLICINNKPVNTVDVKNAIDFAKRFGLDHTVISIDFDKCFVDHLSLAKEYSPVHFVHYTNIELVKRYKDCTVILGNGDPNIEVFDDEDIFTLHIRKDLHREHQDLGGTTIDRFYLYTPELFFSYLFHPLCFTFDKAKEAYLKHYQMDSKNINSQYMVFKRYIKPLIFAEQFDEINHVPKMNGFEDYEGYWKMKELFQSQCDKSLKTVVTVKRDDWLKLYNQEVKELIVTA